MNTPPARSFAAALASRSAPWRAKAFLIAVLVALLGLGLRVRDGIRREPVVAATDASAAGSAEQSRS